MTAQQEYHGDHSLFAGAALVVPMVSYANLPQLTVDLLIHSLGLRRLGTLGDGSTIVPMVGALDVHEDDKDLDQDATLTTGGMEVYGLPGKRFILLQQRSPVLQSKRDAHVALLCDFIKSHAWSSVVLLASLNISMAEDDESVMFSPWRSVVPADAAQETAVLDRLKQIPRVDHAPPVDALRDDLRAIPAGKTSYPPSLPDGGLCREVLQQLESTQTPHGALIGWCAEGDNRGDAFGMAGVAAFLLGIEGEAKLREPKTWAGLFGGEGIAGGTGANSDLYG